MKYVLLASAICLMFFCLTCQEEEAAVSLRLSNPQGKAVPFYGYYIMSTSTDTFFMDDYTPREYNFSLERGQSASGIMYKDTIDVVDTLQFEVFVNGEEHLNQKVTEITQVIQFQVSAQ
jgi:hypothetical protein